VSDCFLMPSEQCFSYFMERTRYISIRWWWCPLCTRPTLLVFWSVSSLRPQSTGRHVAPLGNIILTLSLPVFAPLR